jgi:putative ABC transport system ATP-binding protein
MNNKGDKYMNTVIEVKNVSKTFGKGTNLNKVLDNCSLCVNEGEFVSLMGASGSGKSTLLYLIGGLDRDFEGKISLAGEDIGTLKDNKLSKLRLANIGFVFQFYNLVMNLNVEDNILLPMTVNGKKKSELKKELDEILEITGLTEKRKAMPATLSGGQQQRVAIARAILGNPSIILADEPTGNLDSGSTAEIMGILKELYHAGRTVILITHDNEIAANAGRIIRIKDGKIVEDKVNEDFQ